MNKQDIYNLINKKNPTIFEIGCADGKDTIEFINTFGDLSIFCFEPEPKNINLVKQYINYSKHYLFEGVVSNIDGQLLFNRSRTDNPLDLSYSGSVRKPKEHLTEWPFIKFDEQIKVKSTTLDTFCEQNKIDFIDFIWADVQGAEEDLIKGASRTLENKVKFLYIEYSNKEYYEGQMNLESLKTLLGPKWNLIKDYGSDALFENTKI
jgi:FkbM family methyltransferase